MKPIEGSTRVYGVVGHPVAHSRSPALWNMLFEDTRTNGVYVAFPVAPDVGGAQLADAIRTLGVHAVNLTIPHKTRIVPYLHELTETARRAGAVNFVRVQEGRLIGDNTDGGGFLLALSMEHPTKITGLRAVLLGAGGAARAIAAELLQAGAAEVTLLNRSVERAQLVSMQLRAALGAGVGTVKIGPLTADAYARAVKGAGLVVNCTGGGASDTIARFDPWALDEGTVWSDLNYWSADPPLLQLHRDRRLPTQDGLLMLVCQALLAFQAITGCSVDPRPVAQWMRR